MNAADLVQEVADHGLRIDVKDNRISIEGPQDVLTDQMAEHLRQHKPELLRLYGQRIHGILLAELHFLAGDDWPLLESDSELLGAFAHAVRTRRMREAGELPPEYAQPSECERCGPVLLWKGAPERVEACPWCFNRLPGLPVPRAPCSSPQAEP